MRKPCPCCGGVPGGFGGTLVVNSQPADLQAENARLRVLLAEERAVTAALRADRIKTYADNSWANRDDARMTYTTALHNATAEIDDQIATARAAHRNAAQQEGQDAS